MDNKHEWLKTIQAGDRVVVSDYRDSDIENVEKVTPTQIVLRGDRRYRRSDGSKVGPSSPWMTTHLEQVTHKIIAQIEHRNAVSAVAGLSAAQINHLTTEQLTDFMKLVRTKEGNQ